MKKFLFLFLIGGLFFSEIKSAGNQPAASCSFVIKKEAPSDALKREEILLIPFIGLFSYFYPVAALAGGLNLAYEYFFCDSEVLVLDRYQAAQYKNNKTLLTRISDKPYVPGIVLKGGLLSVDDKNGNGNQIIPSIEMQVPIEINNSGPQDILNENKVYNHISDQQSNFEETAQKKAKSSSSYFHDFLIPAITVYALVMAATKYASLDETQTNASLLGAAFYTAFSETDTPLINNGNSRTIERTKAGLKAFTAIAVGAKVVDGTAPEKCGFYLRRARSRFNSGQESAEIWRRQL